MSNSWDIEVTDADGGFLVAWLVTEGDANTRFSLNKTFGSRGEAERYAVALRNVLSADGIDPTDRASVVGALKGVVQPQFRIKASKLRPKPFAIDRRKLAGPQSQTAAAEGHVVAADVEEIDEQRGLAGPASVYS